MSYRDEDVEAFSLGICKGISETDDALLVEADHGNDQLDNCEGRRIWIPKSVLAPENEVEEFERGECYVARWWARDKGIDDDR